MQSPTKRIIEDDGDEYESVSDYQDAVFAKCGCCYWLPCLRKWGRIGTDRDDAKGGCNWNVLMKVREWSEVAAGPKWKTFVRRLRRNRFRNGRRKFRYDALSYSLNFDESAIENQRSSRCHEDWLRRDFSTRYASMNSGSGSGKMLMDVGSRGESSSACLRNSESDLGIF